jgi:hypothetical protein
MPFYGPSYTGQGIVQQTERSRVGELLGAGFAGLGEGLGKGIEKMKKREQFKKGTITALTAIGADPDLLKGMEATELAAYAQMYPQIAEGKFYSELAELRQRRELPRDFTPQISAAEQRLTQAQQEDPSAGFRPEFEFFKGTEQGFSPVKTESDLGRYVSSEATSGVFRTPSADQLPTPNRFQMFESGQGKEAMMRQRPSEEKGRFLESFQPKVSLPKQSGQVDKPAPTEGDAMGPAEMPGPSEEVRQAAKDLELLKVAQEKGETRLENADEMRDRITREMPKLLQENPLMAKEAYELMYDQEDKLTFDQRLKLQEHLDKKQSLFIPSRGGYASDSASAKEMRSMDLANNQVQSGVSRLLEILDTPGKRMNYDLKKEANTIVGLLTGALRVPITGPGAFSEPERKLIEGLIPNPTDFFRMDSRTRTSLETLASRIAESTDSYAVSIGLGPAQMRQQGSKEYNWNPSTGKLD